LAKLPTNFRNKVIPLKRLWTHIGLSWQTIINPPDVLFIPAHVMPLVYPQKTVVTIHDLAYKYFPEVYSFFDLKYLEWSTKKAVKKAAKIIVPSQATKNDLIKFYSADPQKIVVIYHGCDTERFKPDFKKEKIWETLLKYGILKSNNSLKFVNSQPEMDIPYILYVGRIEDKKNIKNLITAFSLLKKERGMEHKLILAGKPGYKYNEIKKMIKNLNLEREIIETGFIDDDDLPYLYAGADIFVFPSRYEGFGMPILEAFACGVPVVASDCSSIPEIANEAAFLVDTTKPISLAAAMSRVIHDVNLKKEMIWKGLNQVKKFTWEKCAKETLKVLEGV
jgi:glycosyltransferase involved in cell wall biosynthesis